MNLTLSKRGDYVMRAAIFLAHAPRGTARKIREVVADTEVPSAFASQILADLVRAGLATSKAGRDGGYQLSREPSAISALEIVEAAEGPLAAERCALGEGPCKWDAVCPLHETWFAATQSLRGLLAATNLAELASRDDAIAQGTYTIEDSHRRRPLQVEVDDSVQVEREAGSVASALGSRHFDVRSLVQRALATGQGTDGSRAETSAAIQPVRAASRAAGTAATSYQIIWRVEGPTSASHAEADLVINPIDDTRCSLGAHVLWHEGGATSSPGLEARAKRLTRVFLRELAHDLEASLTSDAAR